MLKLERVTGGYFSDPIVQNISFSVEKGEFFGILGPNGSGKTTLLKMISGILPVMEGKILIDGKEIHQYSRKKLAQKIAVLSQISPQAFSYTVKETVELGRYAHQKGVFHQWTIEDEKIVQQVMEETNTLHLQHATLQELSGGEQQRVYLAQALVQQPDILLLDEPTNHLDLAHQKNLLDLLKKQKLTVVSVFHELNLASLYCDRLLLLNNGRMQLLSSPDEVLTESQIKEVYQTEVRKQAHYDIAKPQIHIKPELDSSDESRWNIDASLLKIEKEKIVLQSPKALRTVSSGVVGSGIGWRSVFINRKVPPDYQHAHPVKEMEGYLANFGFPLTQTVAMMTAVEMDDACYGFYEEEDFSVLTVVTAGVGNAIDSTKAEKPVPMEVGTINIWVFVNGKLSDEAFIQGVMTATEGKAQVLRELEIVDEETKTIATGTPTDSILIAATQSGRNFPYAGAATDIGRCIGKSVYNETKKAIEKYLQRKQKERHRF
ncbi:MAG TPA: adenosylcobinamide amidohydrolase [Bacillota bacterium]|nr:adenosylcobinamide amidohydrolase [Bacillota bacterium]